MASWCCSWLKQIPTYHTWGGSIQCWWEWSCRARSTCEGMMKTWTRPVTMNLQVHNAGDGAMAQVIPTKNLIQMSTLYLHPSSTPPTSPDQSSASSNMASDMTFLIKTGKWIAVKDVVKLSLLKLPNGWPFNPDLVWLWSAPHCIMHSSECLL